MTKKIRVSVEIYDHEPGDEYYALPDNWDSLTQEEQENELVSIASDALAEAAGSSATVVEVDENGREV
jgi:hypothetical protein